MGEVPPLIEPVRNFLPLYWRTGAGQHLIQVLVQYDHQWLCIVRYSPAKLLRSIAVIRGKVSQSQGQLNTRVEGPSKPSVRLVESWDQLSVSAHQTSLVACTESCGRRLGLQLWVQPSDCHKHQTVVAFLARVSPSIFSFSFSLSSLTLPWTS